MKESAKSPKTQADVIEFLSQVAKERNAFFIDGIKQALEETN